MCFPVATADKSTSLLRHAGDKITCTSRWGTPQVGFINSALYLHWYPFSVSLSPSTWWMNTYKATPCWCLPFLSPACWPTGYPCNGANRLIPISRILILQDRHKIWPTLAEFNDSDVQYTPWQALRNRKWRRARLDKNEVGFFNIRSAKFTRNLGCYILAFVLEQCERLREMI